MRGTEKAVKDKSRSWRMGRVLSYGWSQKQDFLSWEKMLAQHRMSGQERIRVLFLRRHLWVGLRDKKGSYRIIYNVLSV